MLPCSSSYKSLIRVVLMWAVAMAWHLWRIGSGRPDFVRLSDSKPMITSFAFVYVAMAAVRHLAYGDHKALNLALGLALQVTLVLAVAERSHRSSSLVGAILGGSAAVDMVVIAAMAVGIDSLKPLDLFWEVAIYVLVWRAFFKCPANVQSRGYRYRRPEQH